MKVTRKNPFNGKEMALDLPVTEDQLAAWEGGMLAQQAFPHLDADQREFIISGTPPGDWNRLFAFEIPGFDDRQLIWTRNDDGSFSGDASTLDLPVGEWPELISLDGTGNVYERATTIETRNGEFGGYRYTQINGDGVLLIFND